jgi:hypothetical protein
MPSIERVRIRRLSPVLAMVAIIGLCFLPHASRLRNPSIYGDDGGYIAELQARPLSTLMFRPINEHMAPLFEAISWLTWQAAGRTLTRAPLAFTLASYVPFALCLGLLGWLICRETGSLTTALAAVAFFGISPVYTEAVYWYSASSFLWALSWALIALLFAQEAEGTNGWGGRWGMAAASALAPACSAIGLLVGPLGVIRLMAGRSDRMQSRVGALTPLAGTVLYSAVCSGFRYGEILTSSIRRNADLGRGVPLSLQAPWDRLILGLLGVRDADLWLPTGLNLAISSLGLFGAILWARRNPHRGLIAGGLWLIFGGYLLTYCFRFEHGSHWLLKVGRFHLFPQLGLSLVIAPALLPWLSHYDRRPAAGLVVATGLAVALLAIHLRPIEAMARGYRFPEQRQTLAALEHLGAICRTERVTRDQCIAALDPVWAHWFQGDFNGLAMLPPSVPVPGRPDPQIRAILLAKLTGSEREALWGGMDVTRHLRPAEELAEVHPECVAWGRLVETSNAHYASALSRDGMRCYHMTGWPTHLDFELTAERSSRTPGSDPPRLLCVPCGPSPEPVEIWWAGPGDLWSPTRCVRLRIDPKEPPRDWAIPLDCLPHWKAGDPCRIRIRFVAGPLPPIGEPRLLR